jgi:hypothetical protein
MEVKLQKIKINFNRIKDTRVQVMNVFNILEVKMTKLQTMTNDFIKSNHDVLFVFGLDSFKFQSKLIDFEYSDMQKYFYALNNRMYCEYYKLFKIVAEYIDKTIGPNKTFEMIKTNNNFPIYKDLEPYKQYSFELIEEVHKTIILLLNGIYDHIVIKDTELDNYKIQQNSGLNINNFVNTFDFNITLIKQNCNLYISYLDFFHNIHIKHFKRFSKKMKSMDDYLNEDITFDDSPRRKMSKDFDDNSSQNSNSNSSNNGGGIIHNIDENTYNIPIPNTKVKAVHRKSETKGLLKKGIDSVMNGLKIFNSTPKQPSISSASSVSSISSISNDSSVNNSNNLNLIIEEKLPINNTNIESNIPLTEFNITNLTRERSDTINEQLKQDPKYLSKMFDKLSETLDEPIKNEPINTELIEDNKSVIILNDTNKTELTESELNIGKKKELYINILSNEDVNNRKPNEDVNNRKPNEDANVLEEEHKMKENDVNVNVTVTNNKNNKKKDRKKK